MTMGKALVTIVVSTLVFAFIGVGIGYTLGVLAPGYYRNLFLNGNKPEFDPEAMGIGLGLTQGTTGGVVVGVLLVAILAWYDLCRGNQIASRLNSIESGIAKHAPKAASSGITSTKGIDT